MKTLINGMFRKHEKYYHANFQRPTETAKESQKRSNFFQKKNNRKISEISRT